MVAGRGGALAGKEAVGVRQAVRPVPGADEDGVDAPGRVCRGSSRARHGDGTSLSGASPNGRAARHEGRERRLLGLAMAGQTNATDIVKPIASIAFGSCS